MVCFEERPWHESNGNGYYPMDNPRAWANKDTLREAVWALVIDHDIISNNKIRFLPLILDTVMKSLTAEPTDFGPSLDQKKRITIWANRRWSCYLLGNNTSGILTGSIAYYLNSQQCLPRIGQDSKRPPRFPSSFLLCSSHTEQQERFVR